MADFFSGKDERTLIESNGTHWLAFVLIGVWCLLPIFGLGVLVGWLIS